MKRFTCSRALVVAALGVALAGATPATAADAPDFDEAVRSGSQIIENGSFEETVEGKQPVKGWAIAPPLVKALTVKTDTPHHGKQYLSYDIDETRYMYFNAPRVETDGMRVSCWIRGEGVLQVGLWYEMKDYRKRGLERLMKRQSAGKRLDSAEWRHFEHVFQATGDIMVDGKPEKPEKMLFQVGIQGRVDIDELLMTPVGGADAAAK